MDKMRTLLVIYYFAALPTLVRCYGGTPEKFTCQSVCSSFSDTVGIEFQTPPTPITDTNLTNSTNATQFTGCLFGQTAVVSFPSEFCKPDCNTNVPFECACVSEEDAKLGLESESLSKMYGGFVAVFGSVAIAGLHIFLNRRSKERMLTVYKENPELAPEPNKRMWLLVIAIVLLIVGVVLEIQSLQIRNGDYWEGCGLKTDIE